MSYKITSTNPDKQNLNDYIYRTKLESKINQEDLNVCDGQLSVEECTEAIFKMKLNKSPGIDELTVEFYRKFVVSFLNLKNKHCFFHQILPISPEI
jgi:hypothetical protein